MDGSPVYEVHALRYATRSDTTASGTYYRFELYGEPDDQVTSGYYFWLIRDRRRTVLVDCGYSEEAAAQRNRAFTTPPVELLSRLDVRPEDVDHVVLSHMHFDHVGNTGLFPNATFSMARAELEFWAGPFGNRPTIGWAIERGELEQIQRLHAEGRLHLLGDGPTEIFPGIRATVVPGHTPGQLVVEAAAGGCSVLLASDAVHYYDVLTRDRPFHIFTDLQGVYRGLEQVRTLAARPGTIVVPGHDAAVAWMFEMTAPECIDLTRPLPVIQRDKAPRVATERKPAG
ncbi:N-acyl homoserine lactonase family protein [Actinoplanes sp. CA-131856]